jgi:acetyl-CoA carboxylase biotin carboxyl carrier protein
MFEETIASRVRPLAQAFTTSGFARLRVKDGDFELELRRSGRPAPVGIHDAPPAPPTESAGPKPELLTSDLVGVIRLSRPQVSEGQQLDGDRELAFVEALGIRNPVRSRGAGKIATIFVTEGQPVEYGQPLFAIERS